jgi:hypothetical protein
MVHVHDVLMSSIVTVSLEMFVIGIVNGKLVWAHVVPKSKFSGATNNGELRGGGGTRTN